MNRVQVNSSSIASAGHSAETNTLELGYHNGSVYQYFAVPKSVFDSLLSAESKGAFVNSQIKGRYPFRKLPR
jgi:hypothetical protein